MNISTAEPVVTPTMYATENDLSQKRRIELIALMNQRLADAVDLQLQMKQAHWNVKGPSFIALHQLFDLVDEAVETCVHRNPAGNVQPGGVDPNRAGAYQYRIAARTLDMGMGTRSVAGDPAALAICHGYLTIQRCRNFQCYKGT